MTAHCEEALRSSAGWMGVLERVPAGGNSEDTIFPRVCVEPVNRAVFHLS